MATEVKPGLFLARFELTDRQRVGGVHANAVFNCLVAMAQLFRFWRRWEQPQGCPGNLCMSAQKQHSAGFANVAAPDPSEAAGWARDQRALVIPVPTYYPDVTTILGRPVFRSVAAAAAAFPDAQIDCVDVFRRPSDVPQHIDDVIAAKPRVVWLQSGIRCPEAEEAWAKAGIVVVADKCLLVEHRRGVAAKL